MISCDKVFDCLIALGSGKTHSAHWWYVEQRQRVNKRKHIQSGGKGKRVERKHEERKNDGQPLFYFLCSLLAFPQKTLPCRLAVTLVPHAEIRLAKGKWIIYTGLPFRIKGSTMRLPQRELKGTGLRANTLWATNSGTHVNTQNWCKTQREMHFW